MRTVEENIFLDLLPTKRATFEYAFKASRGTGSSDKRPRESALTSSVSISKTRKIDKWASLYAYFFVVGESSECVGTCQSRSKLPFLMVRG